MFAARDRLEQCLRVRVLRRGEQRGDRRLLDDLSRVHHDRPLTQVGHHTEVVGDEQDAHVAFALQLAQQVEDLGLHGDVERGGGLVGDQHVGVARQRAGDRHALRHATGELVRVGTHTS